MCVRSTIQNEECSLPLVRAVMLTKWTSASGHCETQRRTQSGGGVKKKVWKNETELWTSANRPWPVWRTCGQKSAGGLRVTGYERKAVRYICTFMIIRPSLWSFFGRHQACVTRAVELLGGAAWCKWAYICSPPDKRCCMCDVFSVLLQARHRQLRNCALQKTSRSKISHDISQH